MAGWSLILHGGAMEVPPGMEAANRRGCLAALEAGTGVLRGGGSALDAIEAAVRVLEDDPSFNAGYGSVLNADGEVEMDAAFMDGATLDVGAVAAIRGVRQPASVARLMLGEPPILLVGDGARRFATDGGAELCDPAAMIAPQAGKSASKLGHDTVGVVGRDEAGSIAACTSTGGLPGCLPGRIGDSPCPGAASMPTPSWGVWPCQATGNASHGGCWRPTRCGCWKPARHRPPPNRRLTISPGWAARLARSCSAGMRG